MWTPEAHQNIMQNSSGAYSSSSKPSTRCCSSMCAHSLSTQHPSGPCADTLQVLTARLALRTAKTAPGIRRLV